MEQTLPMAIIPRAQLNEILTLFHLQQEDRFSVALPIQEILYYYETN